MTKLSQLPPVTMRLPPLAWIAWFIIWPGFPSVAFLYPAMFAVYGYTSYTVVADIVIAATAVLEIVMIGRMRFTLDSDAIVIIGPLRTVTVPMAQIDRIDIGLVYWAPGPFYGLQVITKQGTTYRLTPTGMRFRRGRESLANEFRHRLGQRHIPVLISDRWIQRSTL